jgi:hypothetical protein
MVTGSQITNARKRVERSRLSMEKARQRYRKNKTEKNQAMDAEAWILYQQTCYTLVDLLLEISDQAGVNDYLLTVVRGKLGK